MKNSLSIVIAIILHVNMFAGGPWTQTKGKGYFKLAEWWTIFDQHYTDSGLLDPNVTTGIFNTSIYAEYGISNRITAIINAPLFSRNIMNNLRSKTTNEIIVAGEALNSLGDIDIGFKYRLTNKESIIPIALSLTLGLPTGKIDGGALNNLQTGDGEFNQILQLDAGKGFEIKSLPAYTSAYVALNNRTKQFSEEFRYGLEFGLGVLNKKLWLNSRLIAVESFRNGANAETNSSTSIFANNSEFLSIGVEASYYLSNKIGVSAGLATAVRGEIIAAAPSYTVGLFFDMNK